MACWYLSWNKVLYIDLYCILIMKVADRLVFDVLTLLFAMVHDNVSTSHAVIP